MRKCLRCDAEMQDDCYVSDQGVSLSHIVVVEKDESYKKVELPVKAAICPTCGYVELYVEKRIDSQEKRQPHPTPKKYYFTKPQTDE